MARKLPWFQFFAADWRTDAKLSLCTPATRGVWIDLICAMHELDRSGELRGTTEQLARIARCSAVEMKAALTDLQATEAADVTERNGVVTVTNRRMKSEFDGRKSNASRQKRCRTSQSRNRHAKSNGDVAQESQSQQSNTDRGRPPKPPSGGLSFSAEDRKLAEWMFVLVVKIQPQAKNPNFDKWANTIRLMREQDKRTLTEIRELFDLSNKDDFWKANIRSPEKLRSKWDDLDARRSTGRLGNSKPQKSGKDSANYTTDSKDTDGTF